jgi:hypothetical protein
MARSLARNTRVFASTLDKDNFTAANATAQNTWEIKVLDGYSFSQDVASQEIGVNEADSEAGCSASGLARGTLAFNTALNPVDVSFGTYVRPYQDLQATRSGDCVERILWASALGTLAGYTAGPTPGKIPGTTSSWAQDDDTITFGLNTSNNNELLPLTLMFVLENTTYVVEQFNVGSAEVDFSIDGIATINWSGNGSRVNEDQVIHDLLKDPGGTLVKELDVDDVTTGQYLGVPATTTTTFLRNKLSTLDLSDNDIYGFDKTAAGTETTTVTTPLPTGGVVTVSATAQADGNYSGGIIYNTDKNEWAFIETNADTANTITVSDSYNTMVANWEDTDAVELYLPAADDQTTISNINTTTNVITLTAMTAADDIYNGGRLLNLATGEWVTIIDTVNATPSVTIASADAAKIATWAGNEEVSLYTSTQSSGSIFCIPITGGTLTVENNITYLTPEELAIVNLPLAGFAGNRVTSGSFTAYLNTGGQGSGGLLQDLLAKIETSVSNNYSLKFHMGADSTDFPRVDFIMPHAQIAIPTTNVEDIISTEISFSAKPWDETNDVASFEDTNEITVRYVSGNDL